MPALRDLTGHRFGMLVVERRAPNLAKKVRWSCVCDCGGRNDVDAQCLLRGTTRSCGCLWKTAQRGGDGPACVRPARGSTEPRTGTEAGYMAHYYIGQPACEPCKQGARRERAQQRAADPAGGTRRSLRWKYQMSPEAFAQLLAEQGGCCAICLVDTPTDVRTSRFHVDHDHSCCPGSRSCGKCIRGLLCHACNTALGNFADDPARLRRALDYLARRPARESLPAEAECLS